MIYVASSLSNDYYPEVVRALREEGHRVHEETRVRSCDNLPQDQPSDKNRDMREVLKWCDTCVLVLPCDGPAHMAAGWMSGQGKKVLVYMPVRQEPDLMYGLMDGVCYSMEELIDALEEDLDVDTEEDCYEVPPCPDVDFMISFGPNGSRYVNRGIASTKIIGMRFQPEYRRVRRFLYEGRRITLMADPENPVDHKAIAAYVNGCRIGFVPKYDVDFVRLFLNREMRLDVRLDEVENGAISVKFRPLIERIEDLKDEDMYRCYRYRYDPDDCELKYSPVSMIEMAKALADRK